MDRCLRHDFRSRSPGYPRPGPDPNCFSAHSRCIAKHHRPEEVQHVALLSVKTGACQETMPTVPSRTATRRRCSRRAMLRPRDVVQGGAGARAAGHAPICMWHPRGANAKDGPAFESVLDLGARPDAGAWSGRGA